MSSARLRLVLSAGVLALSCARSEPASARRPDVFLFVVDTLRADRLGCYGYPRPTSPVLDRLVAEGTIFEDATAQSSWTMFSMVSMLQGRYVTAFRDVFEEGTPTLAEVFQRNGYETLGVCGNLLLSPTAGYGRGFDHYDAKGPAKTDPGSDKTSRSAEVIFRDLWPELERAGVLKPKDRRPPLFVYVHLMDPHAPYLHHPDLDAELPLDGAAALPERLRDLAAREGAPAPPGDPGWSGAFEEMEKERALYDQEVRHVDREIGRFLDRLRALGALERAVIALAADHGEALFESVSLRTPSELAALPPAQFLHREHGHFLFESLVGTPLLFWGEGVSKGLRVSEPVENVDLFPTLLDLAGLEATPGLHGRSLAGVLQGRTDSPREEVRSYVRQNTAVREIATGLKLTIPSDFGAGRGARPTLFSLRDDPGETVNLHDQRPEDVERIRKRIDDWIERHPTESSLGRKKTAQERFDFGKLGYAGEDEDETK
jgi:arylsulfatase A-like enzyme